MKKSIFPLLLLVLFFFSCDSSDSLDSTDVFGDLKPDPEAVAEAPAEGDAVLNIVLGLERFQDLLAERIEELHDPDSPYYHDFRSISEIANEFGADDAVIESVQEYLNDRGISLETD